MDTSKSDKAPRASDSTEHLSQGVHSTLRLHSSQLSSTRRERRFSDTDRARMPLYDLSNASVPTPSQDLEQHICTASICAIRTALETTELLELILSFLETQDVLSLRRTSRNWNDTVQQSPQLRLHFFTYGQWCRPGGEFQLLPLSIPGLTIERGDELHKGQWILVSFTLEAARRICPNPKGDRRVRARSIFEGLRGGLGTRAQKAAESNTWPKPQTRTSSTIEYQDLFVSQPPIIGMQASLVYPGGRAGSDGNKAIAADPRPCAKLSCDAGISLGFLAEATQNILSKRKNGPSNMQDAKVVFKAIVSFVAAQKPPRTRSSHRNITTIN